MFRQKRPQTPISLPLQKFRSYSQSLLTLALTGVLWEGHSGLRGKGGAPWSSQLPPNGDQAAARELLGGCLMLLGLDPALSL